MDIEAGARRRKKLMTEPTWPIYLMVKHYNQKRHACCGEKSFVRSSYSSAAPRRPARAHDR